MAKTWEEVRNSAEYRALSPFERDEARRQYFDAVVAPKVPSDQLDDVRRQFDHETAIEEVPTTSSGGGGATMSDLVSGRMTPLQRAAAGGTEALKGMSGWEEFAAGLGKGISDLNLGAGKLERDVLEKVLGDRGGQWATKMGMPTAQDIAETRARDQALMSTGPGTAGDILGTSLAAAPVVFAPGANSLLGATGYGTLFGGLEPAETSSERLKNALVSGVGSGAITGAARTVPAFFHLFSKYGPFGTPGQERVALDTINRFAQNPKWAEVAERAPHEMVPGSKATLAEVTGDPGIAQLQRGSMAASPEVANALASNRTARMGAWKDALNRISGEPGLLDQAREARDYIAEKLYDKAWTAPLNKAALSPQDQIGFKQLMDRPAMKAAQKEAKTLMDNEGLKPKKSGSITFLHYAKLALDDKISSAVRTGDSNEARVLGAVKEKLLGYMDKLSPDYAKARTAFQRMSRPVNRMEVGQYLYEKLIPAISDVGAEKITPSSFLKVMRDGDDMAKKATGFSGAKLKDVLLPSDMDLLERISHDLGRMTAASERGKVPGSPTAQYLSTKNALRRLFGSLGLPEEWSESSLAESIPQRVVGAFMKPVDERVSGKLANMLVDPQAAILANRLRMAHESSLGPTVGRNALKYITPALSIGTGGALAGQQ